MVRIKDQEMLIKNIIFLRLIKETDSIFGTNTSFSVNIKNKRNSAADL